MGDPTFIGIDPSLNGTGVCVLQGAQALVLETLRPGELRDIPRLAFIRDVCRLILKERTPSFAAIEHYSYDSINRAFSLGEVGGVLRLCVHDANVAHVDVPPAYVKMFATGNAHADKDAVMSAVKDRWSIDVFDDNQADACVLAKIAQGLVAGLTQPTRSQLEVLHKINHPKIKPVLRVRKRIKNFL